MDSPEILETYRVDKTTQQNTICIGHNYKQTNTNNVNKTILFYLFINCKRWKWEYYYDININMIILNPTWCFGALG